MYPVRLWKAAWPRRLVRKDNLKLSDRQFCCTYNDQPKSCSCPISRFPMSQGEQYRHNGQDERTDHARFGTHRSSRQPLWPVQSHIEEVVRRGKSAVGHPIKECLAPVIAEVKAYRTPQSSGSPQKQTQQQSKRHDRQRTEDGFSLIAQVTQPEES